MKRISLNLNKYNTIHHTNVGSHQDLELFSFTIPHYFCRKILHRLCQKFTKQLYTHNHVSIQTISYSHLSHPTCVCFHCCVWHPLFPASVITIILMKKWLIFCTLEIFHSQIFNPRNKRWVKTDWKIIAAINIYIYIRPF